MKRDLLSVLDVKEDLLEILEIAERLKRRKTEKLKNKTLALLFEKPSLRTRVSLELAMKQLGGDVIYLAPQDIQIGKRESVKDIAQNLSLWVNAIAVRTFSHKTAVELAKYASIPVINALDDLEHPCQIIADLLTIKERKRELKGLKLAWVGDGNNVCNSLILGSALVGIEMSIATPKGYGPNVEILRKAKRLFAKIELTTIPQHAVKNADIVYTDTWVSMGMEAERELREKVFQPYQVNSKLLAHAKKDCIVMHCLPAHRGYEITNDVIDGRNSVVLEQAENRLHAQKAILLKLLK
ncbi:MAG: ornithine carbamoyltransferase, partial [Candidatus Thermoplasmatota archaeon]|nr:ornithine carbamoyltransferase [Candidatus Thermoplasmatota archaeon]